MQRKKRFLICVYTDNRREVKQENLSDIYYMNSSAWLGGAERNLENKDRSGVFLHYGNID